MFAIVARQQLLAAQIVEADVVAAGQRMLAVDDHLESFGKQRPDVEPVPVIAEFGGYAKLRLAGLEKFADLPAVAAQEAEFQPVELPLDLVEIGNEQRQIDRMRQRNAKRADVTALQRCRQRPRAARRLIALLQQRLHALPELGELDRTLAAKQIAAKFAFELLDRARQRGLCHIAVVSRARKIQRARHGEE